jgi:hypothetical protein
MSGAVPLLPIYAFMAWRGSGIYFSELSFLSDAHFDSRLLNVFCLNEGGRFGLRVVVIVFIGRHVDSEDRGRLGVFMCTDWGRNMHIPKQVR